jgi:NAD(P)-dependent dehydrogenase (short-subunit alcohol dehydrogenase family)
MKIADQFNIKGKKALITGSSQGIGKGIAVALAEYGADIILHCRTDASDAADAAQEIEKIGAKVTVVTADLSKPEELANLYQQVADQCGSPDILVINASVEIPKLWEEITEQDFDEQVNTNFKSTFLIMQHFAPEMRSRGWGRIVTIGSVQQVKPHPAMLIYAATKSAVLNMVQNLAMQLADIGVTVNNLAPGVIGTARLDQDIPETPERINKRLETPSGQIGDPQDCAAMAVLLCSQAGRFITGQNIFVDGGMSL